MATVFSKSETSKLMQLSAKSLTLKVTSDGDSHQAQRPFRGPLSFAHKASQIYHYANDRTEAICDLLLADTAHLESPLPGLAQYSLRPDDAVLLLRNLILAFKLTVQRCAFFPL